VSDEPHNRQGKGLQMRDMVLGAVLAFVLVLCLWAFLWLGREKVNRNNCLGQMRSITLAMKAYANDDITHSLFPFAPDMPDSNSLIYVTLYAREYVKDLKVFRCPSDQSQFVAGQTNLGVCSYSVVYSRDPNIKGVVKDDGSTVTPVFADSQGDYRPHRRAGQNVFFLDGHGIWAREMPPFPNPDNPKKVWLNPKGY
jgi:hypothetical protein